MMRLLPVLFLLGIGCATTYTTEKEPVPVSENPLPYRMAIGDIFDSRMKGPKQVRIGSAKVKNTIAQILTHSNHFTSVVNLPTAVAGTSMSEMLQSARAANCDFLVIGEIDQFDIIDMGQNGRAVLSVTLEALTFPIGLIVFIASDRKSGIWVNGMIYDRTAAGVISVSLHFIETENGTVVGHASNVESKATTPVNALVFGDIANPDDDWIDIGRQLGLVALHNLSVKLISRIAAELQRIDPK